jgi:hypothetical protein
MKNETIQKSEDFHGLIVKEIEKLYVEESPTGNGPKLYAKMKECWSMK